MKIRGIVKKNLGRGKDLGFPTANIEVPVSVEDGLYLAMTNSKFQISKTEKFPSLAFVGAAETFGEKEKKLEVYILDFNRDLYGKEIEVQLLEKLRKNIKFNSQEELVSQMKDDEKAARKFFKTYGRTE
ncbi:MAG: hypothetical protein A2846_00190 [Candidatus Doudnabacteria bacterium RIFCSPHIGHO2_01_FULL_49_9]|uniref:riboflavin kinase n=1 Tax=Candidatus Doudnabacteria bacterium RIFCSPHIGHO2_01_FULL_49_9 TaxID=1817827 RepID=A0A1F5P205_9BACT|nr:MAG: hypothetical protein A2846_00190 [Candidatus Doudnabacteria bacterium RIFCSPHIGHO2_01_FULL_49_9]